MRRKVTIISNPFDPHILKANGRSPEIIFFENIRFWSEEEEGDLKFAEKLSYWGDLYVNEAFAVSHRSDASVTVLAKLLPSYAGFHLVEEASNLSKILKRPRRPFVAVLGGIKLETKIPLVRRFLKRADKVLIGGAIANTLLHAKNLETGKSFVERFKDEKILRHKKLYLPVDIIAARTLQRGSGHRTVSVDGVRDGEYIVDIGPKSAKLFASLIRKAKTVVWNGPLGFTPDFAGGSIRFARALGRLRAFKVTGGGDTAEMLQRYNLTKQFSHVSTGGGAMLEFLAGKKLPGLEALRR